MMDTSKHTLSTLFGQLGLANDLHSINQFIASHRLPLGTTLAQADFWTPAQASLLSEALAEDSDWAEVVDELAAQLSKPMH